MIARTMKVQQFIAAIFLLVGSVRFSAAGTVREQMASDGNFKVYGVVFGLTVDAESKIASFRVAKVVEPKGDKPATINVKVPEKFVQKARTWIASKKKYE